MRRQEWTQAKEDEWKANLLKDTATEDDALEEYYCVPKQGSGAYIPRVLIDRATDENCLVVRFSMPNGHMTWTEDERVSTVETFIAETLYHIINLFDSDTRHAYGQDFARNGDLSVIGVGSVEQDTRRVLKLTVEMHDVPYTPRYRSGAQSARS